MSDTNNMPTDGREVKGPEDAADAQIDAALAKLDETIERLSALTARLSTPNYEERD